MTQAYTYGATAAKQGLPRTYNPYPLGSTSWADWNSGYDSVASQQKGEPL